MNTLADSHRDLQGKHNQAREAHQRIKEHHIMVTAEIRAPLREILGSDVNIRRCLRTW